MNFDECSNGADISEWKHLYDPDYKMLFNPKVLPLDLLQGKLIGEYAIHELDLFDRNLTADNIAFSNSMNESHTIHIAAHAFKQKKSNNTVGKLSNSNDDSNLGDQVSRASPRSNLTDQKRIERQ